MSGKLLQDLTVLTSRTLIGDETGGGSNNLPMPTMIDYTPISACLELKSVTGGFVLPRVTNAQRDSFTALTVNGTIIYNGDENTFQFRQDGVWINIVDPERTVTGPAVSIRNNIVTWDNITGTLLSDSKIASNTVVIGPANATVVDNIATWGDVNGNTIIDSGVTITRVPAINSNKDSNVTVTELSGLGHLKFEGNEGLVFLGSDAPLQFYENGNIVTSLFSDGLPKDTSSPSALVELNSTEGALLLSRLTDAEESALSSPVDGMILYNKTQQDFKFRKNNAWTSLYSGFTLLQVDLYTNTQGRTQWVKSPKAKFIEIQMMGGGGGGGAGTTPFYVYGGQGGGGGAFVEMTVPAYQVPPILYAIVGEGGLGGNGKNAGSNAGQDGGISALSTIDEYIYPYVDVFAQAASGAGGLSGPSLAFSTNFGYPDIPSNSGTIGGRFTLDPYVEYLPSSTIGMGGCGGGHGLPIMNNETFKPCSGAGLNEALYDSYNSSISGIGFTGRGFKDLGLGVLKQFYPRGGVAGTITTPGGGDGKGWENGYLGIVNGGGGGGGGFYNTSGNSLGNGGDGGLFGGGGGGGGGQTLLGEKGSGGKGGNGAIVIRQYG